MVFTTAMESLTQTEVTIREQGQLVTHLESLLYLPLSLVTIDHRDGREHCVDQKTDKQELPPGTSTHGELG